MNRTTIAILISLVVAAMAAGVMPAYAADGTNGDSARKELDSPGLIIGYNQYYAWWGGRTWVLNRHTGDKGTKPATGLMYNPVIGVRFNGTFALSTSFAYGQFRYNYNGPVVTDRYDADLILSITLLKGFKLFVGPKFMRWEQQNTFNSVGLGLGVSYIRSLYKGLFINASISLIAMLDVNMFKELSQEQEKKLPGTTKKSRAFVIGTSPTLSFGYYFQKVHLAISAGCRFQYLYYSSSINTRAGLGYSSMRSDYIIAPYIGLTFSF